MIEKVKKSEVDFNEKYISNILPGGVGEFFHIVEKSGAAIGLRIPIDQVKDIDSAIKKAKEAGFDATKVMNYRGYRYLEICRYGYNEEDDEEVVEELKKVAKEVSKEDYSNHIENLQLTPSVPHKEEYEAGGESSQLAPPMPYEEEENKNLSVNNKRQNDFDDIKEEIKNKMVTGLAELCKVLNIPIVSSIEELKKFPNSKVIFASKHGDYNTEPREIKEILFQKLNSSNKKTIVGFEFCSNFADVLNDPTKNLNDKELNSLLSIAIYGKTLRGLIEVFNEIQQEYSKDRFEIQPFDITYNELLLEEKSNEERDAQVEKNILNLLKIYGDNNLFIYTGMLHIIHMLEEIIESGNKEGIKINNIVVFLHREYLSSIIQK